MTNQPQTPIPFFIRLCSDKAAFEVQVKQKMLFRMDAVKKLFETAENHEIIVYTPHIMVFRSRGAEVTLSKDGRILIKKVRDENEAMSVANEVLRIAWKSLP